MYVSAIGTATPPARYTKAQCWDAFQRSAWFERLDVRARALARGLLLRENGMEARRLAVDSLEETFRIDPDTLQRRFVGTAPALASEAARRALEQGRIPAADIDAVIVSTCTGYLCPGLSSYVIERLELDGDVQAYDLVGQGCGAALPGMRLAAALLQERCRHVLAVCVEVSSAAMYLDNDPGVLVSACLFGDGAGAAVLSRSATGAARRIAWTDAESLTEPRHRDALRFEQRQGMLRNVLTRDVPGLAADAVHRVLARLLPRAGLTRASVAAWIVHAGGRDVLGALEQRLGLRSDALRYSAGVLREYGNLSSAFLYFVLQAALADAAPDGWWVLCSFGAGFACHGALLQVG